MRSPTLRISAISSAASPFAFLILAISSLTRFRSAFSPSTSASSPPPLVRGQQPIQHRVILPPRLDSVAHHVRIGADEAKVEHELAPIGPVPFPGHCSRPGSRGQGVDNY